MGCVHGSTKPCGIYQICLEYLRNFCHFRAQFVHPGCVQSRTSCDERLHREKAIIGNILYHALDGRSDAESLLIQLQLRIKQSKLYGGFDEGHAHYWWKQWYLYKNKSRADPPRSGVRKGCREALEEGNTGTWQMLRWLVQTPTSSVSSSFTESSRSHTQCEFMESVSPSSSVSSSFTGSSRSMTIQSITGAKKMLYKMWLCDRASFMTPDQVHHALTHTPATDAKERLMEDIPFYDDCLYPEPIDTIFGVECVLREAPF